MPKPNLAAVMSASKEMDDAEPDAPDSEEEAGDPMSQAMSLLKEALDDGDMESAVDAFKSLCTMHGSSGPSEGGGAKPALHLHFGSKD